MSEWICSSRCAMWGCLKYMEGVDAWGVRGAKVKCFKSLLQNILQNILQNKKSDW